MQKGTTNFGRLLEEEGSRAKRRVARKANKSPIISFRVLRKGHKSSGALVDTCTSGTCAWYKVSIVMPAGASHHGEETTNCCKHFHPFLYRLETLHVVRDGGEVRKRGLWSEEVTAVLRSRVVKMLRSSFMVKSPALNMTCTVAQLEGERCLTEVDVLCTRVQSKYTTTDDYRYLGTSHYCSSVVAEEG